MASTTNKISVLLMLLLCAASNLAFHFSSPGSLVNVQQVHTPHVPILLRAEEDTVAETDSEKTDEKASDFKGFGKRPTKKTKSKTQIQREKAASDYDDLASTGAPEYNIFVRAYGTEQWFPVGAMAIPRTAKVGDVIYNSEENLKKGAFRIFPNLESAEVLEYGYNLKVFPDDEIKVAQKSEAAKGNPILGW
eukprot:CAMPEP_0117762232 /NCGR_PEP_ID=MMETSP0947-20121206/17804_1 /TAXON_ID=44440 /ORGANISM="Chattonella subsalsa, Strain CCMP2191" /LENGTH=191 /DNA_ID=CAMNT_0005583477 /DNA_START=59 /DNA_END=631 /DNA_ORIENTATION=+